MKFRSILLLLALCLPVVAQEGSVSVKVNLVAWGEDIPGLRIGTKGKMTEQTVRAFQYSESIKYVGPALLEISQRRGAKLPALPEQEFDPETDKRRPQEQEKEGVVRGEVPEAILKRREKNPDLVALAQLPRGSRQVTILIAPGPGGTFTTYVIDDDPRKLRKGTLRIHNLSRQQVALRCNGKDRKQLSYGDTMVVNPQQGRVIYELAYLKGEKWKMQENNMLTVRPEDQVQFIILQSDATFFRGSTGARSGFLQVVELRRRPEDEVEENS